MKKLVFILTGSTFIMLSCSKSTGTGSNNNNNNPPPPACGTAKTWSGDVSPIITSTCAIAGCHAAGSTNGPGALTSYQQVFANRTAIRAAVSAGTMPKSGSLTADQKNAILCWIDAGAPNN